MHATHETHQPLDHQSNRPITGKVGASGAYNNTGKTQIVKRAATAWDVQHILVQTLCKMIGCYHRPLSRGEIRQAVVWDQRREWPSLAGNMHGDSNHILSLPMRKCGESAHHTLCTQIEL